MAEAMETEAPGLEVTNADPCQGTRHVVSTVSGYGYYAHPNILHGYLDLLGYGGLCREMHA